MDERLEKALDFSNYMLTLNNQKAIVSRKIPRIINTLLQWIAIYNYS